MTKYHVGHIPAPTIWASKVIYACKKNSYICHQVHATGHTIRLDLLHNYESYLLESSGHHSCVNELSNN